MHPSDTMHTAIHWKVEAPAVWYVSAPQDLAIIEKPQRGNHRFMFYQIQTIMLQFTGFMSVTYTMLTPQTTSLSR